MAAVIVPKSGGSPPYAVGAAGMSLAAVGFVAIADFVPALPYVIAAAGFNDTSPILVAGYNAFMCTFDTAAAGGTTDFQYVICDPIVQTQVQTRAVKAGIAPGVGNVATFGAFSLDGVGTVADVFHTITLRFRANVNQQTISNVRLWCGTR